MELLNNLSWIIIIIVTCIYVLVLYLTKKIPIIRGYIGEWRVKKELDKLPEGYESLHDLMISVDGKMSQIDHIVIATTGIFIIETKNLTGIVYGKIRQKNWVQYQSKHHKRQFQNPLHQNYGHMKQLASVLEREESDFETLVVFNERVKLKLDNDLQIIRNSQVVKVIQSYKETKLTDGECQELIIQLRKINIQSYKNKQKHIEQIQQNIKNSELLIKQNICPKCKTELVKRTGQHGEFLGCSNFPKCRYTAKSKNAKFDKLY